MNHKISTRICRGGICRTAQRTVALRRFFLEGASRMVRLHNMTTIVFCSITAVFLAFLLMTCATTLYASVIWILSAISMEAANGGKGMGIVAKIQPAHQQIRRAATLVPAPTYRLPNAHASASSIPK